MKKQFFYSFTVILLSLLAVPSVTKAQTTIAGWTMEGGYDVVTEDGITVCTPNGGDYADVPVTWFNASAPLILADECVGEKGDYTLSARSEGRYWQVCSGYNNHVLRIENVEANSITDFTDASQHNVYYEITFPTRGYKNISMDYAIACGKNEAADIQAVVSVDGGNTWIDAGKGHTASTWWTYDKNTINISANNKDKVIVRLIVGIGLATNWNLDYVTVTGEEVEGAVTADEKDFTLTWPLNKGVDNVTSAVVAKDGLFSVAEYSYGSNFTITGTRDAGNVTETLFQPIEGGNTLQNDENAIVFTIKPKKGLTFTPKSLEFKASKVGTNGGAFDVVAVSGDKTVSLAKDVNPALIKEEPFYSLCSYDLSGVEPTGDVMTVKIYLKNIANNKQYGFADVVVMGDVNGTVEAVPVYTLSVKTNTPAAGSIICNPSGVEFDEGTQITLTATENFGYHFAGWAMDNGDVVSVENPYTFEIMGNTSLTAVYTQKNVYALNVNLEGGANTYLVQLSPEGNVIDGVHWYEEGTDVKLKALNNRILTFTNWEDNTTSAERDIVMDGEKNVTASFSSVDYIVGWDLYYDQPASQRAADYKDESDNAGLLSLRNEAGNTTSWLTRGIGNGQENGKYAARIWKYLSEKWYWEISFSSKGYSNLKLSAAIGDDYNTYSIINAQYSTDGVNYTTFGTYNPPARGWDQKELELPAGVADMERVYIRFMPDYTSPLIGVTSDYDGTSIAEIFVLADKDINNDDIAPKLVNTIPADKSTGASATGSIVLTFDEKVKIGSGDATLNGETLKPVISGKSVVYGYTGLKYATEYVFTVPAGAITDRNGNAYEGTTITFTTMERVQPEARLYDAIVAKDGSGDYTTVQGAIDAAPAGRVKPWLIFVKNGRYKEHVDIPASKPYIHIIGQNRDKAVILDDKLCGGANALHVSVGATVVVNSNDCLFENITLENSYGHEKEDGPQALALNTTGDRTIFNGVAMLSYQDTWITPSTSAYRAFVKNSLVEGAVDFIYNSGDIYLEGDTLLINRKSGGYIVAPSHGIDVAWGYVFNNCVITAPGVPSETSVWLGRPWHNFPKTVFLNTRAEVTIPATGWYETMGGLPVIWADWNTTDGDGNLLDLSMRRDTYYYTDSDGNKVYGTAKNRLTDEEAAEYTIKNVLSGKDNWQPEIKTEACAAPVPVISGSEISWETVPYAICYVVTKGDDVVGFTTGTSYTYDGGEYTVQAVNEFGGLSKPAVATDMPTVIDNASNVGKMTVEAIYSADGTRKNVMTRGLNIVKYRGEDGNMVVRKIMID